MTPERLFLKALAATVGFLLHIWLLFTCSAQGKLASLLLTTLWEVLSLFIKCSSQVIKVF